MRRGYTQRMTQVTERLITVEEFYRLPSAEHGGKMELVRGRLVVHMPVGGPHGEIALALGAALLRFVGQHRLGSAGVEAGFVLARDPDVVRAPDVHFVRASRLGGERMPAGFFPGAPDLAVEVVSPEDSDRAVAEKVLDYLQAGTPRVWVVRPELKTVTVHRAGGDAHIYGAGETLTSDDAGFEAEGFSLDMSSLFA